jgi:hypothetical protein
VDSDQTEKWSNGPLSPDRLMWSSEQERIEMCAPSHLRHIIVIITEMGLRPYKELMPMKNLKSTSKLLGLYR